MSWPNSYWYMISQFNTYSHFVWLMAEVSIFFVSSGANFLGCIYMLSRRGIGKMRWRGSLSYNWVRFFGTIGPWPYSDLSFCLSAFANSHFVCRFPELCSYFIRTWTQKRKFVRFTFSSLFVYINTSWLGSGDSISFLRVVFPRPWTVTLFIDLSPAHGETAMQVLETARSIVGTGSTTGIDADFLPTAVHLYFVSGGLFLGYSICSLGRVVSWAKIGINSLHSALPNRYFI